MPGAPVTSAINDNGMKTARKRLFFALDISAMSETTRQRLLQRAAKLLGGQRQLAERLNVTQQTLDLWIRGLARMSDRKLLELAAILDELGEPPKPG
jgi:transcriptional regulator with XRE-family HTH domain